ncbi:hypothetical protein KIPB_008178, partial [Kipferlia bialata]
AAATSGSEPSDAIRVVNAVLTQLDMLRSLPNVLTLTTSNITRAVDPAFVDRADLVMTLTYPDPDARRALLLTCIQELVRTGIVTPTGSVPDLSKVVAASQGLSGRLLRKLCFIALCSQPSIPWDVQQFADTLAEVATEQVRERAGATHL